MTIPDCALDVGGRPNDDRQRHVSGGYDPEASPGAYCFSAVSPGCLMSKIRRDQPTRAIVRLPKENHE